MDRYICPFCGRHIDKKDILFWEETSGYYQDPIRYEFLRDHGVDFSNDQNRHSGSFNRKYYHPSWGENGISNVKTEDENGYPIDLCDRASHSLTPDSLRTKDTALDWEDDDDFGEDEADSPMDRKDELHIIPMRACPHCHCELPSQFGRVETFHIAMFGGRGSGKTSYLVNLFQQLSHQLSDNNLGSVVLAEESRNFIEPKIQYYEQNGTTRPTQAKNGLMPIVCQYKNGRKEAFLIFYDIAGEATHNLAYMSNHKGISQCETLLMMIDPNMADSTYDLSWKANRNQDVSGENAGDCCTDPLDEYLNVAGGYCTRYSEHIRNVICIVTKMDQMLEAEKAMFSSGDIELLEDVGTKHRSGANVPVLKKIEKELAWFYDKRFEIRIMDKIRATFDGEDIKFCLLGVSTSTNVGKGFDYRFEPKAARVAKKHRIIEPFIAVLYLNGLIPARQVENPGNQEDKPKNPKPERGREKKPGGVFGGLFGKS